VSNSVAVMSIYDKPMWESIGRRKLELMACRQCGKFRYPPSPICDSCLSMEQDWRPVSGRGEILSWVVFHKKYFDDHVPPYNSVAVRLAEGPIIVTNLVGPEPEGNWIGKRVELDYQECAGRLQHCARIA
jgi:uncharacterized OB-fold protein